MLTAYISLGISPNADAIVLQRFDPDGFQHPDWKVFAPTISIAELDSFGRADAVGKIGRLTLSAMRVNFKIIDIFADALISPISGQPFTVEPPDHSGSKRNLHLRINTIFSKENIVEIWRFNCDSAAGGDPAQLLLNSLLFLGPDGATDRVGATLLDELMALHPDVFAPFPALHPDKSGAIRHGLTPDG